MSTNAVTCPLPLCRSQDESLDPAGAKGPGGPPGSETAADRFNLLLGALWSIVGGNAKTVRRRAWGCIFYKLSLWDLFSWFRVPCCWAVLLG